MTSGQRPDPCYDRARSYFTPEKVAAYVAENPGLTVGKVARGILKGTDCEGLYYYVKNWLKYEAAQLDRSGVIEARRVEKPDGSYNILLYPTEGGRR